MLTVLMPLCLAGLHSGKERYHTGSKASPCKGPFLYYIRVKGWVGGISKYLLFLTGVGG